MRHQSWLACRSTRLPIVNSALGTALESQRVSAGPWQLLLHHPRTVRQHSTFHSTVLLLLLTHGGEWKLQNETVMADASLFSRLRQNKPGFSRFVYSRNPFARRLSKRKSAFACLCSCCIISFFSAGRCVYDTASMTETMTQLPALAPPALEPSLLTTSTLDEGALKSFACELCDKVYKRKSDLKIHNRSHTGGKQASCPCSATCVTRIRTQRNLTSASNVTKPFLSGRT